jgi:hypothetical protein
MIAGEYYVGDPCYVMTRKQWRDLFSITSNREGLFTIADSVQLAAYRVNAGDGVYKDQFKRSYYVDSGFIGCILTLSITDKTYSPDIIARLAQIIPFDIAFNTYSADGVIHIGDVRINAVQNYDSSED